MRKINEKINDMAIKGKVKAAKLLENRKPGANLWVDILVACVIGLAIALVLKGRLSSSVESIMDKIDGQLTSW